MGRFLSKILSGTSIGFLLLSMNGCGAVINGTRQDVYFNNIPKEGRLSVDGTRYKSMSDKTVISLARTTDHYVVLVANDYNPHFSLIKKKRAYITTVLDCLLMPVYGAGFIALAIDELLDANTELDPAKIWFPALERAPEAPLLMPGTAAEPGKKITIAILDLKPISIPRADAEMVSEIIRGKFVEGETFTVVDRKDIDKILKEQAFQLTGCVSAECAVKVGRLLGVQVVCTGTYGKLGENLQLILKLVDVETGEILFAGRAKGKTIEDLEMDSEALRAQIRSRFRNK